MGVDRWIVPCNYCHMVMQNSSSALKHPTAALTQPLAFKTMVTIYLFDVSVLFLFFSHNVIKLVSLSMQLFFQWADFTEKFAF